MLIKRLASTRKKAGHQAKILFIMTAMRTAETTGSDALTMCVKLTSSRGSVNPHATDSRSHGRQKCAAFAGNEGLTSGALKNLREDPNLSLEVANALRSKRGLRPRPRRSPLQCASRGAPRQPISNPSPTPQPRSSNNISYMFYMHYI